MAKSKLSLVKASDAIATQPRSGFTEEWAAKVHLMCEILGLSESEHDAVNIEAIRCRGSDYKEGRFMKRVYRTGTVFDDPGYFIEFYSASALSVCLLATMGPFDSNEHSAEAYDCLIEHFNFDRAFIINKPDEPDFDEGLFDMDDDDDVFDFDEDEGLDDLFDFDDEDDEFEGLFD
jgi:hypothetical protein